MSRSAIETTASSEQVETNKYTMIMEMRIRNTSFVLHRIRGLRRILGPKQKAKNKQRRGGMNDTSYGTSNAAEHDRNQNTISDISQHPSPPCRSLAKQRRDSLHTTVCERNASRLMNTAANQVQNLRAHATETTYNTHDTRCNVVSSRTDFYHQQSKPRKRERTIQKF